MHSLLPYKLCSGLKVKRCDLGIFVTARVIWAIEKNILFHDIIVIIYKVALYIISVVMVS
jgi:hypothetical protein